MKRVFADRIRNAANGLKVHDIVRVQCIVLGCRVMVRTGHPWCERHLMHSPYVQKVEDLCRQRKRELVLLSRACREGNRFLIPMDGIVVREVKGQAITITTSASLSRELKIPLIDILYLLKIMDKDGEIVVTRSRRFDRCKLLVSLPECSSIEMT